MSALCKCTDCNYYWSHLDFGHNACLEHHDCHTRRGYDPSVCDNCRENRRNWEPLSASISEWRSELALHCRRLGGEDCWAYKTALSSFFEVLLNTESESGSCSCDPSPRSMGQGSRSAGLLPLTRSTARSPVSRRSRSPPASRGRRDDRSAGFRPHSSPRRSRSPLYGADCQALGSLVPALGSLPLLLGLRVVHPS